MNDRADRRTAGRLSPSTRLLLPGSLAAALCCAFLPAPVFATGELRVAAIRPPDIQNDNNSDKTRTQLEDALRALKQSKHLGRMEAERALSSIEAFREAKRNRKPPQPLEASLPDCVAAPNPTCLLQEALAHAYRVPDQGRRDWALSAIATVYFETGAREQIYSVVALMDDPRAVLRLLEQTVGADIQAPAIAIPDPDDAAVRDDSATAGWLPFAEAENWLAARHGIEAIAEPRYRAVAWARFGRMAIDAGNTALADEALNASEALISGIEFSYARSYARYEASLTHIARVAKANGGEAETNIAAASAEKIEQPHFRADAFWRLAIVGSETRAPVIQEQAEQSFAEIVSRLRQVFVLTAEEIKSDQRKTRALAIATTILDPLDRARAFTRLARYVR